MAPSIPPTEGDAFGPGGLPAPAPAVEVEGARIATVFQPIVSLADGHVIGYEALARPEVHGRPVAPDRWLEAAARAGWGNRADQACLSAVEATLARLAPWPAHLRLFVNLRWSTIADADALGTHWAALSRWVAPDHLVAEVAEHGTRDMPAWVGVRERYPHIVWAQDDLGVGEADLVRWVALRPAWVKVDRALVAGVVDDAMTRAVLRALVCAAHAEGAQVIAEGVETAEQVEALIALGFDAGQGYWFARPAFPPPELRRAGRP
ncbi:MAG: EAL domain-containing protein [Actinomycetia bacterium]|nr:EAL domain-containing protein [Actinomycetes bacterium]